MFSMKTEKLFMKTEKFFMKREKRPYGNFKPGIARNAKGIRQRI